jgi:hypothetical protein
MNTPKALDNGGKVIGTAGQVLELTKATAKSSLTRLTKDLIFQFPLIISGGIDQDEIFPMIKSFEKNYASIVQTAISAEGVIERDKYESITDFLKKFHNNSDNPFAGYKAFDLPGSISVTEAVASEGYLPEKELLEMWDNVYEQLDTSSINDIYLPYKRTAAKLTRAIEAANAVATEASDDNNLYYRRVADKKDKQGNTLYVGGKKNFVAATDKDGNLMYEYIKADTNNPKLMAEMKERYGDPKKMDDWNAKPDPKTKDQYLSKINGRISSEIIKDDKFNALTPTMIRMTLANVSKSGGATWSQELVLGVRAMPHIIPPSLMITNMVQAFKNKLIFEFIKWTKGENSLGDILLGISDAKALAKMNSENRWLNVLRKRAKRANYRFFGYKLNPNCTIIITDVEAYKIKEQCGINPYDVSAVKTMMEKYFLLGFGIYDTEGKILHLIYDADNDFSQMSLRSMIADSKKESNLLAMSRY